MQQVNDTNIIDALARSSDIPWVQQADGVWFRPLRLSPKRGTWANILRVEKAGQLSRHRHLGTVQAFVLEGSWHYLEHDWVARPGDYVFEGPGDVHTLIVDPEGPMQTLFVIDAPYEYLDDDGNVTGIESAQSKLDLYQDHCLAEGIEMADIIY